MKQTFNFLLMLVMVASALSCTKKDVIPLPTADFTFTPDTGRAWITVTFTNTSINATTYAWDFGGGAEASIEKSPVVRFTGGGTFVVTLTATGDGGVTKVTKNITILPPNIAGRYLITERTSTVGTTVTDQFPTFIPCIRDDIFEYTSDGRITRTDAGTLCTFGVIFNPTTYAISADGKTLTSNQDNNGVITATIFTIEELTGSMFKTSRVVTDTSGGVTTTTTFRYTYTKI